LVLAFNGLLPFWPLSKYAEERVENFNYTLTGRRKVGESLAEGQTKVTEKFSAMSTHSNRQPEKSLCAAIYPFFPKRAAILTKGQCNSSVQAEKSEEEAHMCSKKCQVLVLLNGPRGDFNK